MGIGELSSREDARHRRPEVRAVQEVVCGTDEGVLDGLPRCLLPRNAVAKLFGLANRERAPRHRRALAGPDETLRFRQREADILKELDGPDRGDGVERVPPMPRYAPRGPHEAELVVVAQGRRRDTGALGEFADREELRLHDFKRT
jgi:hypothetical protein